MKLTKIFGLVLGLHVVIIGLILVQPGCQSTDRSKASPTAGEPGGTASPAPADSAGVPADFNAGLANPTRPATDLGEPAGEVIQPLPPAGTAPEANAAALSHTVVKGDSPARIAKQYKVSVDALLEANRLTRSSTIHPGQKLVIPGGGMAPAATVTTAAAAAPGTSTGEGYTVRPGDNLSKIAKKMGVSLKALREANPQMKGDSLKPGQRLNAPAGARAVSESPASPAPAKSGATSASTAPALPSGGTTYVVMPGDNLAKIAKKYGVSSGAIAKASKLAKPDRLEVGQKLIIPGRDGTTPTASVETPKPANDSSDDLLFSGIDAPANPATTANPDLKVLENMDTSEEKEEPVIQVDDPSQPPGNPTGNQ